MAYPRTEFPQTESRWEFLKVIQTALPTAFQMVCPPKVYPRWALRTGCRSVTQTVLLKVIHWENLMRLADHT